VAEQDFSQEWTDRALDTVDRVVATVNDKALRPAIVASRAIVFGVIVGMVGLVILVLFSVGFIRLLNNYATDHHVWIAYLALSALFCAAGAFLYSKRGPAHSDD
jgi:H+/Cl- antiporter ClcA